MFSAHVNKKRRIEDNIVKEFISNSQNTHKQVLSNSVAMTILALKNQYFGETPTDESINQHYEACLRELNSIQDESLKPFIQYIIVKTREPIDADFDTVTLFLPTSDTQGQSQTAENFKEEKYVLPLKETLTLVWKALHDNEKYTQNYPGTPAEKLTSAKADLSQRLSSFFNCLKKLSEQRECHHGDRNELVFTLNKTYADVDLIEDERATVRLILKDRINELFWKNYQAPSISAETKKTLTSAMLEWMSENNPSTVLKILDTQNLVIKSLRVLFIKHGSNPENIKLDTIISDAMSTLDFACDPKAYPVIAMINVILNILQEEGQNDKNLSVSSMQDWIKTTCQLDNKKHQKKISDFYIIYQAQKDLNQYYPLLKMLGKVTDSFNSLSQTCEAYFAAARNIDALPALTVETLNTVQLLKNTIRQCKADSMCHEIENFFVRWFVAKKDEDVDSLKQLYAMLVDDTFQSKVIIKDEEIRQFMEHGSAAESQMEVDSTMGLQQSQTYRNIRPYQINRIFLHAILQRPEEWSVTFRQTLYAVLQFVENDFKQPDQANAEETAQALKQYSYPPILIEQLNYLVKLSIAEETPRPKTMILLPHQVKNIDELHDVVDLLSEERYKTFYQLQAVKINQIVYENFVRGRFSVYHLVGAIPEADRLAFLIQKLGIIYVKKIIEDRGVLAGVLNKLPQADRLSFITEKLGIEYVQNIITSGPEFACVLKELPEAERFSFITEKLGIGFVKEIIEDGGQLADVLMKLPAADRFSFVTEILGIEYVKQIIKNGREFDFFLSVLPEACRISFITEKTGLVYVKQIIENGTDLAIFLSVLPEACRFAFITQEPVIEYVKRIIKNGSELGAVLSVLPETDRLSFITEKTGIKYAKQIIKNGTDLAIFLSVFPEAYRLAFITQEPGIKYVKPLIQNGCELARVLKLGPEAERLSFITEKLGIKYIKTRIKSVFDLSSVLEQVPEAGRLTFITEKFKIFSVDGSVKEIFKDGGLPHVLSRLLEKDRICLITEKLGIKNFKTCINNGFVLARVLEQHPEADRFSLITEKLEIGYVKEIIKNGEELAEVLEALPEAVTLSFITEKLEIDNVKKIIKTAEELAKVLEELPQADRFSFITEKLQIEYVKKIIKNGVDLADVLRTLPEADIFSFIIEKLEIEYVKKIIKNWVDLVDVLERLAEADRFSFITEKLQIEFVKNIIKNGSELAVFLSVHPEAYRLAFITQEPEIEYVKTIIKNGSELADVLKMYPLEDRLSLLTQKIGINNIKNGEELSAVLKCLLDTDKISFVTDEPGIEYAKTIIKNGRELAKVLNVIPKTDRVFFISQKLGIEYVKNLITNVGVLMNVLNLHPKADKLAFLTEKLGIDHIKKINKSWFELDFMLNLLPNKDKLSFITSEPVIGYIKEIVKSWNEIAHIFNLLPKADRLLFITQKLGIVYVKKIIIKNDLTALNMFLTDEDQKTFALWFQRQAGKISLEELGRFGRPGKPGFFSPLRATEVYDHAARARTDSVRFSILARYVCEATNKEDTFCKALIKEFGEDFFASSNIAKAQTASVGASRKRKRA